MLNAMQRACTPNTDTVLTTRPVASPFDLRPTLVSLLTVVFALAFCKLVCRAQFMGAELLSLKGFSINEQTLDWQILASTSTSPSSHPPCRTKKNTTSTNFNCAVSLFVMSWVLQCPQLLDSVQLLSFNKLPNWRHSWSLLQSFFLFFFLAHFSFPYLFVYELLKRKLDLPVDLMASQLIQFCTPTHT